MIDNKTTAEFIFKEALEERIGKQKAIEQLLRMGMLQLNPGVLPEIEIEESELGSRWDHTVIKCHSGDYHIGVDIQKDATNMSLHAAFGFAINPRGHFKDGK